MNSCRRRMNRFWRKNCRYDKKRNCSWRVKKPLMRKSSWTKRNSLPKRMSFCLPP
jgi:hypothetical protein